jgi:putative addiction module component (TIGR02574 family)
MHPAVELLRRLPVEERLQILEELWEDIPVQGVPIPAEALQEAHRRYEELQANPEIALTRDQVWEQVRQRDA